MNLRVPRRCRTSASICIAALATAGCTSSLLETDLPPSTSYVLAPAPKATTTVARTQVDLSIGRPDLRPGLDSQRIAVLKGRELDYYRSARWGSSTTELVQSMIVDSLEDQQLFRSVTAEQARVAGDYVLDIEVRDFQAEYASDTAAPVVHVAMLGRLIRVVDRKLVATLSSEAQDQANDNRMSAVAASFELASQKVAVELAQKVAVAIATDEPSLRAARGEANTQTP
jgi:cholesterol transport system auxiliary component